jgi:hypothetical protein
MRQPAESLVNHDSRMGLATVQCRTFLVILAKAGIQRDQPVATPISRE